GRPREQPPGGGVRVRAQQPFAHPDDGYAPLEGREPQIQQVELFLTPRDSAEQPPPEETQPPPLPPPRTIGSFPAGSQVPPQNERIDAAKTDRVSRLRRTLSNQSESDNPFVFRDPDRGKDMINARLRQQQQQQQTASQSSLNWAKQFIAYLTTPSQQTDQQEASRRRRRAAQQVDRILAAQSQAHQEADR
ncbi:MAG: hypothetical protein ACKPKO_48455, partial [Candidatus Fonsibacter sp.]